jgi:hypothetical protein
MDMIEDNYIASKAFVQKMRSLANQRDLNSIRQAVQHMQDWMREHPEDVHVGTALEGFDILEEAARLVEQQNAPAVPSMPQSVSKV